ncbi:hypothetical protein BS47DRAFT_1361000 [Hydnum rufescens UP504]|uniref:Uncharacterized protein n=1 Tax=Hydnum rufescens UP504 TaxID=1448309 RepID=A0A9P6DY89_9AGAM|nr:hypothetical protein BS47DRAFT_1361000 [Hydnum rufescens UP504]
MAPNNYLHPSPEMGKSPSHNPILGPCLGPDQVQSDQQMTFLMSHKPNPTLNVDKQKQSASCTLEMISSGQICSHIINITTDGMECCLWYYHHGGIAVLEFIALQWGVHPFITYHDMPLALERVPMGSHVQPSHKAKNNAQYNQDKTVPDYSFSSMITVHNARIQLGTVMTHCQYTLVGRGTVVIGGHADPPDLVGWGLMIKISWPSTDRVRESDIINVACICMAKNNNHAMLNHIPEVLHAKDYLTTPTSDHGGRSHML